MIETKIGSAPDDGDTPGRRGSNKGRGSTGRRSANRESLFLSATIRRRGDSARTLKPLRVRNLSAIGMMADYTELADEDEPVIVTVRGIGSVGGTVAWVRRGRIGIVFDVEVDPKMARKPVGPQPAPPLPKHKPL
jgi:hypothetical protein